MNNSKPEIDLLELAELLNESAAAFSMLETYTRNMGGDVLAELVEDYRKHAARSKQFCSLILELKKNGGSL